MATHHLLLHLILMLNVIIIQAISGDACIDVEREALLAFKAGVSDGTKHGLSSWNQREDCCSWRGVICDNTTGNVLELNLYTPYNQRTSPNWSSYALSGEINPSLLALNHLTRLDLSNNNFSDISIPEFFGSFKNLMHLNLSYSEFVGKIPDQLGNLSKLQSLDLTYSNFIGTVPPHLGNLSGLQHLSLNLAFDYTMASKVDWLSSLTSLEYLDMGNLNLTYATDWLQIINKLQSLKVLLLGSTSLPNIPSSLSYVNFTGLTTLDLSYNWKFNTTLPSWLWNITNLSNLNLENCQFFGKIPDDIAKLTSLTYLNLGWNKFEGTLPRSFGKLCNLRGLNVPFAGIGGDIQELVGMLTCNWNNMEEIILSSNNLQGNLSNWLDQMPNLKHLDLRNNSLVGLVPLGIGKLQNLNFLDLSSNYLHGVISNWLEQMTNLKHLDLSSNSLIGSVPIGIGKLRNLNFLDLSSNSLHGVISEAHFANQTRLKVLHLSSNSLRIMVDRSWVPPFQLNTIYLRSCQVGPQFPVWLRWQIQMSELDLSNTSITGTLPNWLWSLPLNMLDLSYNQITGKLPSSLRSTTLQTLSLRSNNLEGPLPPLPNELEVLDLSNNYISGTLPLFFPTFIEFVFLSSNLINGSIPSSICEQTFLWTLDLSRNNLSEELPRCWLQDSSLLVIDLSYNNITGEIPPSLGLLTSLFILDLNNNNIYGELPSELQHCTSLKLLNLGNNKYSGKIPIWIGEKLLNLKYLQLRSNMFDGNIPPQLAHLTTLQVLDLADNNLSGMIPRSFGNFTAMVYSLLTTDDNYGTFSWENDGVFSVYEKSMDLVMQGKESRYSEILHLVTTMDLSGNNLSGEIPEEIFALGQLRNLNFSGNNLIGRIPKRIGDMLSLESLDLSSNELSGAIPSSLSKLTFLDHLNLSYNNLSGSIPSGSQLGTLDDPSIYIGNAYLCGPPTSKNCSGDQTTSTSTLKDGNGSETMWLYLGMAVGFVVGFWGVYSVLLFRGSWRKAYFQMIDNLFDKIYVTVAITVNRLRNKYG